MTISGQELLRPAPPEGAAQPLVSVVVPTKNERGNVATLVERLDAALPTVAMEIVFVDDSTDGTAELVEEIARRTPRDVVLLRQAAGRRIGGLGGAVLQGIRAARAPWVCVMDADLQHPPELITALLEQAESRDLDLVVASRYCMDGDAGSFGWARAMASRSTTTAARMLFPRRLRDVSDPMSGFFLVRRDAVAVDRLRPRGFKILLELLVRNPGLRTGEVSFAFGERRAGRSKATIREGVRYLSLLARLRFARFGVVGLSGLVVNTLLLAFLTDFVGLFYVVSAVIATQGSTLWNFCFTELWVFSDRQHRRGWHSPLAPFFLMNNAALALRGPLLILLTSGLGVHYVVSNVISLVTLTLLRFALADTWIWAKADPSPLVGRSPHVLYTNVVEPILRWTFAERGYALVHAACLAEGERAVLVTARTDTGKTTTSLRILDREPWAFLSDDLTLLTPDGRVLTYPKPLTISRHTLKAVKRPLLSRRERAGLLVQSRL